MFLSDLFQNEEQFLNVLFMGGSFVFGWISKHYVEIYANSKKRITSIRKLIDTVDDALIDDSVSEEEFRKTFYAAKEVIQK
jgi:hypothetical protein